jgi:hypothetical protein
MDDPGGSIDAPGSRPAGALGRRQSRRATLQTYVPPAVAVVGVASVRTLGTSGKVQVGGGGGGGGTGSGGGGGGGGKKP